MKGYTVYAKNKATGKGTGLEVSASKKVVVMPNSLRPINKEGRVIMRFFTLEEGDKAQSMRFILTPAEAFGLHLAGLEVAKNGGKKTFTHKYEIEGKETKSEVALEKWEREGKSGYAMIIRRGEVTVNIPMDMTHFLYIGELLKFLSTDQAWSSYQGEEISEETGRGRTRCRRFCCNACNGRNRSCRRETCCSCPCCNERQWQRNWQG